MCKEEYLTQDLLNSIYYSSCKTFADVETQFGVNQERLFNKLYTNTKFIKSIPQCDLDALRHRYKELCKESNVTSTPNQILEKRRNQRQEQKSKKIYNVDYNATEDQEYEDRVVAYFNRNEEGKIYEYRYKILIRDSDPLEGFLTPEQMQMLYFLYSNQGRNLPTNKVLESFPQYTINELKKIIRAFNITKCSEPFAPHFIESHTEEELSILRIRYKGERSAQRAAKDESKGLQDYIKEQEKKINELNLKLTNYRDLFTFTYNGEKTTPIIPEKATKSLVIYLSDMHIGAYITKYALFYHNYDLSEIKCRLHALVLKFANTKFDNVIICNLGDAIDGANGQTARGTKLIQFPDGDKEMYKWFMEAMLYFFDLIYQNIKFNDIYYFAVGESNHGGSYEYVCQKSLENALHAKYNNIYTNVFDESFGMFKVYDQNFLITHGNDSGNMFKSLPLTINTNPKAENYLTQLLDNKFQLNYAHIIKGDLHNPATSFGNRFRYRSVGCLLGSNDWSGANFGDCKAMVDYDIISNQNDIWEGRVIF